MNELSIGSQGSFSCSSDALQNESQGHRLSKVQVENSISTLLKIGLSNSEYNTIHSNVILNVFLPGDSSDDFKETDSSIRKSHAESYMKIADNFATQITQSQNQANNFIKKYIDLGPSTCNWQDSSIARDCFESFAKNFILRAFRRPYKDSAEITQLLKEYQEGQTIENTSSFLFRALLSPHFLLQLYDHETALNTTDFQLSTYSFISKLSFLFTNNIPPESLITLAAQPVTNYSEFQNQAVELLFTDKESEVRETLKSFYAQWLDLENTKIPEGVSRETLDFLVKDISPGNRLVDAMNKEIIDFMDYIFASNKTFSDVFSSSVAVTNYPDLMKIYDQTEPVASVDSALSGNEVRYPANERVGILTRAAFLSDLSIEKNHVHRGVKVLKKILCTELPNPDNLDLDTTIPPLERSATTREKVHVGTSGQSCVGCHKVINPHGFALANYNSFGAFELNEPVIKQGSFSNEYLSIDSRVDLPENLDFTIQSVNNAVDFSEAISINPLAHSCFTKKFYHFAMRKPANLQEDGCHLNYSMSFISENSSLKDFFKSYAKHPRFSTIRKSP